MVPEAGGCPLQEQACQGAHSASPLCPPLKPFDAAFRTSDCKICCATKTIELMAPNDSVWGIANLGCPKPTWKLVSIGLSQPGFQYILLFRCISGSCTVHTGSVSNMHQSIDDVGDDACPSCDRFLPFLRSVMMQVKIEKTTECKDLC